MPKQKKPTTEFGVRLIALRQARGMTQIQLAAAIDSTQRAISYYETGGGYPAPQVLIALARILDVTSDQLLGLKPGRKDRTPDITPETLSSGRLFRRSPSCPSAIRRLSFASSLAATTHRAA